MKIYELIKLRETILKIKDLKLSIDSAYQLASFIEKTEKDYTFYKEQLQNIIEEYGIRDDEGNILYTPDSNVSIIPEKIPECTDRIRELEEYEITTPTLHLKKSDFNKTELSIIELLPLLPYFEEKKETL